MCVRFLFNVLLLSVDQLFMNTYSDSACGTLVSQDTARLGCEAGSAYGYYGPTDGDVTSTQYLYFSGATTQPVPAIGNYLASQ